MKNLLFALILTAASFQIQAQVDSCDFTPSINEGDLFLVENSDYELTTQSYDTYQWFVESYNTNFEILGTDSIFPTNLLTPGVNNIYLLATANGCTISSDTIEVVIFFDDCGMGISTTYNGTGNNQDIYLFEGDTLSLSISNTFFVDWFMIDGDSTYLISEALSFDLIMEDAGYFQVFYEVYCENSGVIFTDTSDIYVYSCWQPTSEFGLLQDGNILYFDEGSQFPFTWFLDGIELEGENSTSLEMTETGNYSLEINVFCYLYTFNQYYIFEDDCEFTPSINEGNLEIFEGALIDLTTQSFDGYEWYIGGNNVDFNLVETNSTYSLSELTTGQHFIYLNATLDSCSTVSDTILISVYANDCGMGIPETVVINGTNNPTEIFLCQFDSLELNATYPGQYNWYISANDSTELLTSSSIFSIPMDEAGVFEVYYEYICFVGVSFISNTIQVNVFPTWLPPTGGIEIVQDGNILTTYDEAFPANYTWYYEGQEIMDENSNSIIAVEEGNYSVELDMVCGADNATFYYTELCDFTPTINEGNLDIIEGALIDLTTQDYDNYEWYIGSNNSDFDFVQSDSTYSLSELSIGQYFIYLNATLDSCSTVSDTILISVYANDCGMGIPETVIINGESNPSIMEFCQGDSLVVSSYFAADYIWTLTNTQNDSTIIISNDSSFEYILTNDGSFELNYEVVCAPGISYISDPIGVIVSSNIFLTPDMYISQIENTLSVGDMILAQYQWFYNGTELEGETDPSIIVSESGLYSVEIYQNCASITFDYNYSDVSIEEYEQLIELFPNPASDVLNIKLNTDFSAIKIIDSNGRIVYSKNKINNNSIDISFLESGMYYINIYGTELNQNLRFVKN